MERNNKLGNYIMAEVLSVNHLLFVDDVLIYMKTNYKLVSVVKEVIRNFLTFTGLQVYLQKSSMFFSTSVTD